MAKIDFENRQIIGKSGKVYKISPETLSSARTPEFEIRSSLLAYRTNLEELFKLLAKVKKGLKEGRTFGDVADAIHDIERYENGLLTFHETGRTPLIEFCALFCIAEGEDISKFNEDIIREKWEDWNEITDYDFFLLSLNVIPSFKKKYLEALENQKSSLN
jgi:hypothetical protein